MTIQFLISSASLWELVSPLKKKQLKHCLHYNSYLYTIHYKVKPAHFSSSIKVTIHASQIANSTLPTVHFRIWLSQSLANSWKSVWKCDNIHKECANVMHIIQILLITPSRLFSRMNRWKTFYEVVLPARDWKLSYKSESGLLISRF